VLLEQVQTLTQAGLELLRKEREEEDEVMQDKKFSKPTLKEMKLATLRVYKEKSKDKK